MQTTENLGLRKPEENDFYDVNDFNNNSDALDALFEKNEDGSVVAKNAKTLDGHGAEYFFPKSGGEVDGNVEAKSTEAVTRKVAVENSLRRVTLEVGTDGTVYLWDATNGKPIGSFLLNGTNTFNGTASGNLPLTGGTVEGDITIRKHFPIQWFRNTTTGKAGKVERGDGYFGLVNYNTPEQNSLSALVIEDATGDQNHLKFEPYYGQRKTVFHTGNKPTGSYTGNEDATERTISTGGTGNVVIIYSSYGVAIVTTNTVVLIGSDGSVTTTKDVGFASDGVILIKTNNRIVNGAGTIRYTYV